MNTNLCACRKCLKKFPANELGGFRVCGKCHETISMKISQELNEDLLKGKTEEEIEDMVEDMFYAEVFDEEYLSSAESHSIVINSMEELWKEVMKISK